MNKLTTGSLIGLLALSSFANAEIKKGDQLQTLANIHADAKRHNFYAINYQLPGGVIPPCTPVTITKVKENSIVFTWNDVPYKMELDKYTKGADKTVPDVAENFFGAECDKVKLESLSATDKAGVASGEPELGMTKEGVLFAMGRPPYHANPDLESNTWNYWRNRFGRRIVEFDDKGIVVGIK